MEECNPNIVERLFQMLYLNKLWISKYGNIRESVHHSLISPNWMLCATSNSIANALYRFPYSKFGYADILKWSCDGSLIIWWGDIGTSFRTAVKLIFFFLFFERYHQVWDVEGIYSLKNVCEKYLIVLAISMPEGAGTMLCKRRRW